MRAVLLALLLAVPAMAHAAADKPTVLPGKMPSLSQGRPSGNTARFAPAPVPNPDLAAPAQRDTAGVLVSPGLTRTNTGQGFGGDGFAPGSVYSGTLERRSRNSAGLGSNVAPSLSFKVPVQVDVR